MNKEPSYEELKKKCESLEIENQLIKERLNTIERFAFKKAEIYRIEFIGTQFAYVGKTSQSTERRFIQHTRDVINKFLKLEKIGNVKNTWKDMQTFLGDDNAVLECLFFKVFKERNQLNPREAIEKYFTFTKQHGMPDIDYKSKIFEFVRVWRVKKIKYLNECVVFTFEGKQQEEDRKNFKLINKRKNTSCSLDLELNKGLYKVKDSLKQIF